MEIKMPDIKVYKWHIAAFFVYLIISLAMFWNISGNFGSAVPNGGGDVYQSMWGLWWVPYAVFALHQSPYITQYLFSPIGANLVSQTMSPLAGIITAPLQAVAGVAATYNTIFFLSFALGGLFMFMLARYLVKNDCAAFIAGLVFAFSPMHIAQAYSHLQWTTIEFIPLFVLFLLLMIREKKKKYALYSAIAFIFLTFAGDIEQGIMMVAFAIAAVIILLVMERKDILNRHFLVNAALLGIFILVLGSPFLISISQHLGTALSSANQLDDIAHNMLYSDNLASFFLPSYYNGIFHGVSLGYVSSVYGTTYQGVQYTPDITEKVSYIGFSVILLALLALYHEHRKNRMRDIIFWIAILVVFGLLAVGPNIQIGSTATGIPTLYSIYRVIPGFNLVREPGRFDVVVTLALAVLAAIGFDHLSKSRYNLGNPLLLLVVFSVLILIEYNGMPLSGGFANSLTTNAQISPGYSQIRNITGNYSVLELPALPNLTTGSYLYPGMSMYYQTAFQKPIFGGYTTRTNASQQQILENVPLIVETAYLQSGNGFIYPYPVQENYDNLTLFWLTAYKVGVLSVINKAYAPGDLANLQNYLSAIFGSPLYQDSNATIYSTATAENLEGGRSVVAYIVGTWIPGYEFCSPNSSCNSTFATIWWGSNVRGITVFTPNDTAMRMDFQATSYSPGGPLYIFLNNGNTPVSVLNLTSGLENYSVTFDVPTGLNQLDFYQQNSSSVVSQSPYLNFGIRNVTFTRQ
ncbi:MAG TPA: hypothetical protein VL945_01015 [Candidatus Saccharimonadales bacterium]|nr:hypothetical protein [Candidatus Saccharimonadales bacterium]